jgi:dolichol-phosphate mannosyltransferase
VTQALVVMPTYCEIDNLEAIVERVLAVSPEFDLLIVDDNSPDGTGQLADHLAATRPRLHVLHRTVKDGIGAAYRAGFAWALARDFTQIFEMDADGSHQPEQLPELSAELDKGADMVIGTRWMPGAEVRNWPTYRRLLSKTGTWFARFMLRSRLRDITSGFRGFTRAALVSHHVDRLVSQGYCFQIELAWTIERSGSIVREVPIVFVERVEGHSKMSLPIIVEAMWMVWVWGLRDRLARPEPQSELAAVHKEQA